MKVKTAIISYQLNDAGCDKKVENMVNEKLAELAISPDDLIDIKVNTNYCGNELYNQINYKNVDESGILVRYVATIIYKTEE